MCDPRELIRALRRSCPVMVAGACVLRRADANTREPGRGSDAIDDVTSRHRMHGPCFGRGGGCDVVDVGESSRRTKSNRSGMRRRCAEPRRLVLHIHPLRPARLAAEPLFLGAGAGYPRRHQADHRRRYLRGFGADVAQIGASVIDTRAGDVGSSHRRNEGGQHDLGPRVPFASAVQSHFVGELTQSHRENRVGMFAPIPQHREILAAHDEKIRFLVRSEKARGCSRVDAHREAGKITRERRHASDFAHPKVDQSGTRRQLRIPAGVHPAKAGAGMSRVCLRLCPA